MKLTKRNIFATIMAIIFSPFMLLGLVAYLPIIYTRTGYDLGDILLEAFEDKLDKWGRK